MFGERQDKRLVCEEIESSHLYHIKVIFYVGEEWDFEHQKVCGFIRQYVDDNVYNNIAKETQARTLWEKIKSFELCFLSCLINLRYKESSSLSNHLDEFQGLLDQLSGMNINFDDEILELYIFGFNYKLYL